MECAFAEYNATRKISTLAREYLAAANKPSLEELVPFLLGDTSKTAVAQWAKCVFTAAEKGDPLANGLLKTAAGKLAHNAGLTAKRLGLSKPRVALVGGLFENQPGYLALFQRALKQQLPGAEAFLLTIPRRARFRARCRPRATSRTIAAEKNGHAPAATPGKPIADPKRLAAFASASTEQRNPPLPRTRSPLHPATRRPLHPRRAPRRERTQGPARPHRQGRHPRRKEALRGRPADLYRRGHQRPARRRRLQRNAAPPSTPRRSRSRPSSPAAPRPSSAARKAPRTRATPASPIESTRPHQMRRRLRHRR